MSQPVPTSTQAGWGGDSADTGMSAADKARDWGEQEAAIQPRIIDPAGQAPKALAAVPEAQQAGGAEVAAPPGAGGWRQLFMVPGGVEVERGWTARPSPQSRSQSQSCGVVAPADEIRGAKGVPLTAEAQELLRQAAAIQSAQRPCRVQEAAPTRPHWDETPPLA